MFQKWTVFVFTESWPRDHSHAKKGAIEWGWVGYEKWKVMQIEEGVIHQGRRWFLSFTFRQIKWTVCKKWKGNSKKFQLLDKSFLMVWNKLFSKLRMFWSKLCKSNWISTWNLAFPFFYLTYCMEYVWKSSLRIGIFHRATQRPGILLTDNIQSGGSYSVNYY